MRIRPVMSRLAWTAPLTGAAVLLVALAGTPASALAGMSGAQRTGPAGTSAISVGSDPDGITVDSATDTVYVANFDSDDVSVIDGATGAVTATIPVGSSPAGIAVDDDTDTIYVANHGAPTVSVIDGATDAVTATLTVGGDEADAIAVDPVTNKIFVTTYGSIAEIDGATDAVTPDWARLIQPTGISDSMALDLANGNLYLVNYWTNDQVEVINTATGIQTGYVQSGAGADAVAVDPVKNLLYVANCEPGYANGVWIFDLTTGNIKAEVADSCPTSVAVDAANATGVALDEDSGTTSFISAPNGVLGSLTAPTTPGADGPTDPATGTVTVDAATGTVYIADQTEIGTVTRITQTAPMFTSGAAATFTVGTASADKLTAAGVPQHMVFTEQGRLPKGLRLSSAGDLSGNPAAGTGGSYKITLTAANGFAPNATARFTLTVRQRPAITSAASARFRRGRHGSFRIKATGYPAPRITEHGRLPKGLRLRAGPNGTATLAGTASRSDKAGSYVLKLTATNATGKTASQTFRLRLG